MPGGREDRREREIEREKEREREDKAKDRELVHDSLAAVCEEAAQVRHNSIDASSHLAPQV